MTITGAIFDCDGTLLDSMPMWFEAPHELLGRHGITGEDEFMRSMESLNLEDECEAFHERFGAGESGAALLDELNQIVCEHYAHDVQAFPGAREFVASLVAAGIPMAIATSTPVPDVLVGLRANGMDGFFGKVFCTSDVGRGKEYPDVYLAALDFLGTPRESTWVFEDAPFGVATANSLGFPVACIYNDHDGRDPQFLAEHATIFSNGYDAISIEKLRDVDA